jgi:hypothetical protein
MRKFTILLMLVTLFLISLDTKSAQACGMVSLAAKSTATQDNRYTLVVIQKEFEKHYPFVASTEIRDRYKVPGLYPNDGSVQPIWTMDFETEYGSRFGGRLYTSFDGKHLVSVADTFIYSPLLFISDGKVIKEYNHQELGADTSNSADCRYEWIKEVSFSQSRGILTVEHLNGSKLSFSIYTGERVLAIFDSEIFLLAWIAIGTIVLGVLRLSTRRKRQLQNRNQHED